MLTFTFTKPSALERSNQNSLDSNFYFFCFYFQCSSFGDLNFFSFFISYFDFVAARSFQNAIKSNIWFHIHFVFFKLNQIHAFALAIKCGKIWFSRSKLNPINEFNLFLFIPRIFLCIACHLLPSLVFDINFHVYIA